MHGRDHQHTSNHIRATGCNTPSDLCADCSGAACLRAQSPEDLEAGQSGPVKIFMAKHQHSDHAKNKYASHKDQVVQLKVLLENPGSAGFPGLQLPDKIVVNVAGRALTPVELSLGGK